MNQETVNGVSNHGEMNGNVCDTVEEKVTKLPMENVLWMLGRIENTGTDSDEEGNAEGDESGDVWTVCDSHNYFIGARTQRKCETATQCVKQLLIDCMLQPLSWSPRRPKFLALRPSTPELSLDVHEYGILSTSNPSPALLGKRRLRSVLDEPVTSCSTCDRSGARKLFMVCPDCKATLYCTKACLDKDISGQIEGVPGHDYWCSKMKDYMEDTKRLSKFPFSFSKVTTDPGFDEQRYKAWQQELGVFGKGLWRREWSHFFSPFGLYHAELREESDNDYILAELNRIYLEEAAPTPPVFSLLNWNDYLQWRNLAADFPAAILMQWPLTLYHIIVNLFSKHYPKHEPLTKKKELIIHIIGVEKEIDILTVFNELGKLMPNTNFKLVLIGNEFEARLHGKKVTHSNCHGNNSMTFTIHHGLYHGYRGPDPDLVVGFNAGLGAYPTWSFTLQKLAQKKFPAFITDYFHISCECSRPPLVHTGLGDISAVEINPFRCPVRRYVEEHRMPSYSNGYVFSLCYEIDPKTNPLKFGEFGEIL